jgi:MFS family permease
VYIVTVESYLSSLVCTGSPPDTPLRIQPASSVHHADGGLPLAGRIADRTEPARLSSFGIAAICVGLPAIAATIGQNASLSLIAVELVLIGTGYGVFITPNSVAIMGSVETRQYGVASGMIGTMRTLGMVTSMSTIILIFSVFMGGQSVTRESLPQFVYSMRVAMLTFAGFSCLGVILSLGRGRRR